MLKLTALLSLAFFMGSCGQASFHNTQGHELPPGRTISVSADLISQEDQMQENRYYPFELKETGTQYQIVANLEGEDLYPKYFNFFQSLGYEGNGYCWEGHIIQILEKLDRKLLSHIEFDPEAGFFMALADSRESQVRFAEILSPEFSDLKKLEKWVRKADRSRIED